MCAFLKVQEDKPLQTSVFLCQFMYFALFVNIYVYKYNSIDSG